MIPDRLPEKHEVSEKAKEIGRRASNRVVLRLLEDRDRKIAQLERLIVYAGGILAHGSPGSAWMDWIMRVQGVLGIKFHVSRFKDGNAIPFVDLENMVKDMPRVTISKLKASLLVKALSLGG